MKKNFEKELPEGYTEALHINAKDKKLGLIFNAIALVVTVAVLAIAAIPVMVHGNMTVESDELFAAYIVFIVSMLLYIVLHELVHGIAYKHMTGEKLTFGISWSCAFCGVPNIYVYRRTALIACGAPLVVFSVILIPLTVSLYFASSVFYFISAFILGLHLGGCCGDIYLIGLLLFKFKNEKVLVRDTGPEQFLCIPSEDKI